MSIVSYFKSLNARLWTQVQSHLLSMFTPAEPVLQGAIAIPLDSHGNALMPEGDLQQWLTVDLDNGEQELINATLSDNVDVRSISSFQDLTNENDVCIACAQEYRCNKKIQDACAYIAIERAGFEIINESALPGLSVKYTDSTQTQLSQLPPAVNQEAVGFTLNSSLSTPGVLSVKQAQVKIIPAPVPYTGATFSEMNHDDQYLPIGREEMGEVFDRKSTLRLVK